MKRKYELDEIKTIIKSILDLPESNKLYIHGEALREIICKKLWPGGTDIYIDNLEISDFGSNKWALGLYSYSSEGWNNKYACNNIAACSRYIAKDKLDIIWRKFKSDINKDPLKSDILASAYDINSFRANLKDFYDKYLTKDISLDQALDEGIIVNRSNRELLVHNLNCGLYHYRNKYSSHYLNANGYEKERILSDRRYILNKDAKDFLRKKKLKNKMKEKQDIADKLVKMYNKVIDESKNDKDMITVQHYKKPIEVISDKKSTDKMHMTTEELSDKLNSLFDLSDEDLKFIESLEISRPPQIVYGENARIKYIDRLLPIGGNIKDNKELSNFIHLFESDKVNVSYVTYKNNTYLKFDKKDNDDTNGDVFADHIERFLISSCKLSIDDRVRYTLNSYRSKYDDSYIICPLLEDESFSNNNIHYKFLVFLNKSLSEKYPDNKISVSFETKRFKYKKLILRYEPSNHYMSYDTYSNTVNYITIQAFNLLDEWNKQFYKQIDDNYEQVKEEKKMANKTMKEIMLESAENAAYIVASDQTTKLLQKALVHLITKNSSPEDASKAEEYITMFAKSEAGNAAIKLIASVMLLNVPNDEFKADPRVTKLANTLMTNGMATAGNFVMDAVTDMAPEIMKLVNQIPEQPKIRVPEIEQKVHVSTTDTTMASAIEEALEHEQHKPVAKKNHIK